MSIASSSMLVELNISVWTANKVDRTTSSKLAADNNAASDAAQVRKNLMAGTTLRKEIADFAALCRLWHNLKTLPWSDRGPRLLPTSLFIDYKEEANKRKARFDHMVTHFLAEYPTLQAQAQQHLGDLYNPADYPSVDEVASKFGFRMVFTPLAESGDFRLDLPAQEIADMRKQYDEALNERVNEALRSQWDKLHEALTRMSGQLEEPEHGKLPLRETFVSNARELCAMLGHLNVTKDPKLDEARLKLERAMLGVEVSDLKEDIAVREDVRTKLDAILKEYEW